MVEEFASDGADQTLGEGVLPGGARCRENLGNAHAFRASPELVAVNAVAIAKKVARRRVIGESLDDLLRRPGGSGGIGDVEVHDLPAMMQQDHEDVEHSKGRSGHDEEVDRDEVADVVLEERAPSLRGWFRPTRNEPGHGALRDVEAELEQLAVNARRAPERIRERHGAHEIRKLRADRRSTHSPRRDFQVQKARKPCRCQRTTVSGRTRWSASRHPAHWVESHIQRRRSRRPNCGRFDRRRSRASCCRSARFSSVRSARVLSAARRAPNRASARDIALHGSHAACSASSLGFEFGKRQRPQRRWQAGRARPF